MHSTDAKDDCALIDDRLVRSNALLTTILLTVALFSPRPIALILLAFQSLVFFTGIWFPKSNPYRFVSMQLHLVRLFKQENGEHPKPVRFSQQVGMAFIVPAFLILLFGFPLGLVLVTFCLVASALNAFAGICIACRIYPRLILWRHRFRQLFSLQIR